MFSRTRLKETILSLPLIRNRTARQKVKWLYWTLRRMCRSQIPSGTTHPLQSFREPGWETFFGYYDLSPLSADQNKLLAHLVPGGAVSGRKLKEARVGYFDLVTGLFNDIGVTHSWSWQMGSRLRWHPQHPDSRVLFHATINGRHSTLVYDLPSGKVVKEYQRAIFDVAHSGKYGVAVNFSRLGRLRPGYGYFDVPDDTEGDLSPTNDGLWLIDLASSEEKLLVSFAQLAAYKPESSMLDAQHYANMVLIAPDGCQIAFLHLWVEPAGTSHVRLIRVSPNDNDIVVLADDAKPSHGYWLDSARFLITMVFPGGLTEYRVIHNGGMTETLDVKLPGRDGHPSLSPCGRYLLTDSYPDAFGEQNLEVFDLEQRSLTCLGRFAPGISYLDDELRCDLHPRWSPRGDKIVFDSAHDKGRMIYVADFSASNIPDTV